MNLNLFKTFPYSDPVCNLHHPLLIFSTLDFTKGISTFRLILYSIAYIDDYTSLKSLVTFSLPFSISFLLFPSVSLLLSITLHGNQCELTAGSLSHSRALLPCFLFVPPSIGTPICPSSPAIVGAQSRATSTMHWACRGGRQGKHDSVAILLEAL